MNKRNIIIKEGTNDDFLIICDHASNRIPKEYGNLGIKSEEILSHRAFDIGAADVAKELSNRLDCTLIMSNFSRLLIDPNRGTDDPTLIPKLSEDVKIKGNIDLKNNGKDKERLKRITNFYLPYHNEIEHFYLKLNKFQLKLTKI